MPSAACCEVAVWLPFIGVQGGACRECAVNLPSPSRSPQNGASGSGINGEQQQRNNTLAIESSISALQNGVTFISYMNDHTVTIPAS